LLGKGVNCAGRWAVIRAVRTPTDRPTATIVILAWNAWDHTSTCLDSLQPTLSFGDQVVVVDNGSTDVTAARLGNYGWIEVISNDANRGFAAGCNQGAEVAQGDVIVFLNNDTVLAPGWLEELLGPFSDPEVGATGPRSNNVSGSQLVRDAAYRADEAASVCAFAESWRRRHTNRTTESPRLAGFCVAVRTEAFRAIGGFDEGYPIGGFEDDDLCMELRAAGYRLLVAHGAFVHHAAHATFKANDVDWHQQQVANQARFREKWGTDGVPRHRLLSICLIVKDEEDMLEACLDSVAEVADEVVVYDTGSTDRTVEIARAAGAVVIEGYWDDSFARARNAALAHTRGEWVISLDADETLLADPETLRTLLEDRRSDVEAYLVAIENLHGAGNARSVHTAIRLFRRTACAWRHRLHEQVVAADDPGRRLRIGYLSGTRIIHHGYAAEVFESKNKAERNLALAAAGLDDEDLSPAYALMNYGRALESAGRSDEAIDALREAIAMSGDPITRRLAVKNLIYIFGRLARFDEALAAVDDLRVMSSSQIAADIAEGRLRISMGDAEEGLALLARVPMRGRDDEGMEYAAHMLAAMRGEALASLGRFGEAADVVLDAVRSDGVFEADLGELVAWLARAERSPAEIAEALEVDDLVPVLGRVLRQPPPIADAVLEGVWARFPERLEPLAAASRLGPRLPVARALVWSSRLRVRGLESACPLVAMAQDKEGDPRVRILAGAAAFGTFADRRVVGPVHEARSKLGPAESLEATAEIERLAPGLLEARHLDVPPETVAPAAPPITRGRPKEVAKKLPPVSQVVRRRGLNVVAPFESTVREGDVARTLVTALRRHGGAVSTSSYHADGRAGPIEWKHEDQGDHPFDATLLVLRPQDIANFVIDRGSTAFEDRYMIAAWLWDYGTPSELMGTVARMVHEIWVPSRFAADAIAPITDRRVARMCLPVGPEGPASRNDLPGSTFTFVANVDYDTGFERQNPLGLVEAFRRAFPAGAGPRLAIATSHAEHYPAEHAQLMHAVADRREIEVHRGTPLPEYATSQSCFVSLHRSEGTGLHLARAMARGIPTIATAHSFSAELQGDLDAFLVRCALVPVPASEFRCGRGGRWAEPDLDEAAEAMKLVLAGPKAVLVRARRAQERARRQFGPSRSVRVMTDRLTAIDRMRYGDQAAPKPQAQGRLVVAG
jgi:GT2 family glycosyltransferase